MQDGKSVHEWSVSFLSVFAQIASALVTLRVEVVQWRRHFTAAVHVERTTRVKRTSGACFNPLLLLGRDLQIDLPAL